MDFLNNKDDNLDNSSSDYSDEEFDYIDYDTIDFEKPIKNKDDIYIANLDEKIILELDNLDIFEIIEEEHKKFVIFNLDLDNEDHNELIEILYNLDEKALEKCLEYAPVWFNKEMSEKDVENLYLPLYIDNYKQKGHVLVKVLLDEGINITDLHISNINIIEIKGLIFYKKTFLYHVMLKSILQDNINLIDNLGEKNTELQNTIDNVDTIDTVDTVDTVNTVDTTELQLPTDTKNIQTTELQTPIKINTTLQTETPNKTIESTGSTGSTGSTETIEDENISLHKIHDENILKQKRLEVKEKFMLSEKLNEQAEKSRIEAIESANELQNIEKQLNNE